MARLKKNGVVVRDYVPVKNSSNQPGFWDKVSQSFVGNSNLTAGPVLQ
jgi:hypothetical protein